jgi:hypothetical protein
MIELKTKAANNKLQELIKKIDEGASPPGTDYILSGFTQEELNTFKMFIKSFIEYRL